MQVPYTHADKSLPLRALSYYLVLFPSFDVISIYPLATICMANNIYMVIAGRDTSEIGKWKYDWVLRVFLRFFSAVVPILLGFGAANLVFILVYAGLLGFSAYFLFPIVLQLSSIYVCSKVFGQAQDTTTESVMLSEDYESSPLVSTVGKKNGLMYMTPYSNVILSHPIFVAIVGFIGFSLCVISVVGIFIGPEKLTCEYYP